MTFDPVAVRNDHQFPAITAEIVNLTFAALRPGLPAITPAPDARDPAVAWKMIGRLVATMPFSALSHALERLELAEGPHAPDALYAFTWGFYHSRAENEIFAEDD